LSKSINLFSSIWFWFNLFNLGKTYKHTLQLGLSCKQQKAWKALIISEKFKQLARTGSIVSELVLESEDVAGVISSCSFSILVFLNV